MSSRKGTEEQRRARIASNEALFRTVNEKIEDVNAAFAAVAETFTVVCECGDDTCIEQIEMPVAGYERVREDPTLFVIVPGHEVPEVETVVGHGDGFDIVKKQGAIGESIAAATDPRA